jgi:hypothetical protein
MNPFIVGDFVELLVGQVDNIKIWGENSPPPESVFVVITVMGELMEVANTPILEPWLDRWWSWERFRLVSNG